MGKEVELEREQSKAVKKSVVKVVEDLVRM